MTKTLALALVVSGSVLAQPPLAGQHAPQPVSDLIILPGGVFCGFDVQATAYGKAKTIRLPNDGFIATSPGLDMTLTNLGDTSKQVSLNITGAFHVSTDSSGIATAVSSGRSILFNPSGAFRGIVLMIGRFTFVVPADPMQPIDELQGQGIWSMRARSYPENVDSAAHSGVCALGTPPDSPRGFTAYGPLVEDDRWVGSQTMPAEDAWHTSHHVCRWKASMLTLVGSAPGIELWIEVRV